MLLEGQFVKDKVLDNFVFTWSIIKEHILITSKLIAIYHNFPYLIILSVYKLYFRLLMDFPYIDLESLLEHFQNIFAI